MLAIVVNDGFGTFQADDIFKFKYYLFFISQTGSTITHDLINLNTKMKLILFNFL